MTKAISVSGLHKSFGRTHALDGLDLEVATGEVHGFLGPNGAGKSTTIRVLLGLLRADARHAPGCSAATRGATRSTLHRRLAYVPGDVTLWPQPLRRRGHRPARPAARRPRRSRAGPSCSSASSSTRPRRAAPTPRATGRRSPSSPRSPPTSSCCILDEPTSGLDPLMEAVFQRLRRGGARQRAHGAAVQPHPRRGRGAVRPGQHHPRRPRPSRPARSPSCAT